MLTQSDPRGLAIGFVAFEALTDLGWSKVADWLKKPENKDDDPWYAGKTIAALTGVSFFSLIAGSTISRLTGYEVSLGALIVGSTVSKAARVFYELFLNPIKEDPDIIKITKDNFQKEVVESDLPVIIDCYHNVCPPCKKLAPVFSEMNKEMKDKYKFVKLQTREEVDLAKELAIKGVPTLIFFKNGEVVDNMLGFKGKEPLLDKIKEVFA